MTREEALNKAIGILTYNQVNFCKSKEAVANMNEIIDALEKIDQEQCGDCISRQDVEDAIYDYSRSCDVNYAQIMEFIDKLPSVTPQPCDDAISRQAVIVTLTKTSGIRGNALKALYDLPPVSPQPKMGRWEWLQYDGNPKIGNWHCSECGCIVVEAVDKNKKGGIPLYKYCPQCGCKLQEVEE